MTSTFGKVATTALADGPSVPRRDRALRPYSVAGEFVYDRPFQWGSKRTGPDLGRVGGRYSDDWHRLHLTNPRDVVPESNMPPYAFLDRPIGGPDVAARMKALKPWGIRTLMKIAKRRRSDQGQDRDGCADRLPPGFGHLQLKDGERLSIMERPLAKRIHRDFVCHSSASSGGRMATR